MAIADLFDHRSRVYRESKSDDAAGFELVQWSQIGSDSSGYNSTCAEPPLKLMDIGAGDEQVGMRIVNFPAAQDAIERDIVHVYNGPESSDTRPLLLKVVTSSKPRGHHRKLICEPWDGELATLVGTD